jgi:hypothetical protein
MKRAQYEHGIEKLRKLAVELGLSEYKTCMVIDRVNSLTQFYNWVNADEFIGEYLYEKHKEENSGRKIKGTSGRKSL